MSSGYLHVVGSGLVVFLALFLSYMYWVWEGGWSGIWSITTVLILVAVALHLLEGLLDVMADA